MQKKSFHKNQKNQDWMVKRKMMSKKDWIINLENAAAAVAALLGKETVQHILQKYDAKSIDDLSPCYFSEVFDELDFMANDARD